MHSADASALGFLYQGQYALLLLWRDPDEEATIYIECLDDVHLVSNGETLLQQLKHSLQAKPPALTLASVSVWKTLRAWINGLSSIDLSHTWFHLVAVAGISPGSPLEALLDDNADRGVLEQALLDEAERILSERATAARAGSPSLPHAERFAACKAFLGLDAEQRSKLLRRARIRPNQPNITEIENLLAAEFTSVLRKDRAAIARELIEWWNAQILDLLTKKRAYGISRFELVKRHMELVRSIQLDELTSAFDMTPVPPSYQPDGMIRRQIELVGGGAAELKIAVREEWRAREERSRWSTQNPARDKVIRDYDELLVEAWADRHMFMVQDCQGGSEQILKGKGSQLLRWTLTDANRDLAPISPQIISPHYVRGSYQVLSINGNVGWHPDYRKLLGFEP
ncbi:ABC-three component system protein [Bosea sp. ASV33]|uniref:ABC-three component system protein n=1 Tax=Bosea sp. ASV33 TaxID=2795106 RepID=UPI0018EBBFB7|nr:ABC-three component system protein [Bosea sp. ASV33]